MSFQDEYKITNADRLDKGVYGLPDTPGMTTAAIQERFDSLGNLAIDKFNALVEAASDVIDGSDTKFPTNKAVEDYISGEGGAIIDDTTPSLHKAYSSEKVEIMFGDVASRVIDDNEPSSDKTYSSAEIEEKLSNIPSPGSIIDDDTASTAKTYSSSKLESDFISVSDTEEQTATDEFTTINGGILSSLKVSLSPNQNLHGYSEPWVGGAGKNKLPLVLTSLKSLNTSGTWTDNTYVVNGLTFDVSTDDGGNVTSISVNGTASGVTDFLMGSGFYLADGSYTATCKGVLNNYYGQVQVGASWGSVILDSSPYTFTATNSDAIIFHYYIRSGVEIHLTNVVPMIRLSSVADDTFEPYSNICPISGHTQAKVGDDGKNKADPNTLEVGYYSTTGYNSSANFKTTTPISVEVGKTYFGKVFNTNDLTEKYDVVYTTFSSDDTTNALRQVVGGSITIQSGEKYVRIRNNSDHTPLIQSGNFAYQLELGSIATPYVPYNGYQVTVNLGGTYYSGVLDVVTGVFTPDTADVDLGTLNWSYSSSANHERFNSNALASLTKLPATSADVGNIICENYKAVSNSDNYNHTGGASMALGQVGNGNLFVYDPRFTDTASFTSAVSGVKLVYELATPTPIQLPPTMVKALVGENHLSAPLDGQEITESKYKQMFTFDDVIAYIQSLS